MRLVSSTGPPVAAKVYNVLLFVQFKQMFMSSFSTLTVVWKGDLPQPPWVSHS